jgi:hypothetical protein
MSETTLFVLLIALWTGGEFALGSLIRTPQRYVLVLRIGVVLAVGIGVMAVYRR